MEKLYHTSNNRSIYSNRSVPSTNQHFSEPSCL